MKNVNLIRKSLFEMCTGTQEIRSFGIHGEKQRN